MKHLLSFNEIKEYSILTKYPKKPGESTSDYSRRIAGLKEKEQEAWKPVETTKTTSVNKTLTPEDKKSQLLEIIPKIKTGDTQFDTQVEKLTKSYVENMEKHDEILDKFLTELRITKNEIYNSDGSPKEPVEILELLNSKGLLIQDETKRKKLSELSEEMNNLVSNSKNEGYYYYGIWTVGLGIIGTLAVIAWLRGRTRLTVYQTAGPNPTKWYQKAYNWLKSKGIDLSFGLDPNREHPLIVSDRPYGRTYGINKGSERNDRVRTVLDPSYGPEKGESPLVTGSGTKYGFRTNVG